MSDAGGVIAGVGVLSQPISLLLVQSVIIISLTRALSLFNSYIKQPRVVMEVIGGILLGPSAIGRNENYMDKIFPSSSLSTLNNIATFGLVLYLFLVGMELDPKLVLNNGKATLLVALIGTMVPFAIGVAISPTLYDVLILTDSSMDVEYISFMVFIGVAMSITAFPVLSRVLTETKLLASPCGALTLGAAAVGDVIAWCLLALAISIASAGKLENAAWIFLCVVGLALVLFVAIRPILKYLVNAVEASNSSSMRGNLFALTIVLVYLCAWTTELLGVHPIFGAFIFGLIVPRKGRFVVDLTEKIEDFVQTLLLPLYFAYSGLKTNIATINSAKAGGLLVLVIALACLGKVIGCGSVAKLLGMSWRESGAVGFLMSTRGLVELIVLNVGLQKKILNVEVFTIMVIMALVTTLMTVPVVELIYPPSKRQQVKRPTSGGQYAVGSSRDKDKDSNISVVLDKIDDLPLSMGFLYLFAPVFATKKLTVTAMNFAESSPKISQVMAATNNSAAALLNPSLKTLSMFCSVVGAEIETYSIVGNPFSFSDELCRITADHDTDLIVLPWRKSVNIVGDHFNYFLTNTLQKAPAPVALLISHQDVDESEELKPVVTQVIKRVAAIITGLPVDMKLLDMISHYQTHTRIETTIFAVGLVPGELKTKVKALKQLHVLVVKLGPDGVAEAVKKISENTYDLVLCSYANAQEEHLDNSNEATLISPRPRASSRFPSPFAYPFNAAAPLEFGLIGQAVFKTGVQSLLIVVHPSAVSKGVEEQAENTDVQLSVISHADDGQQAGVELQTIESKV